VSCLPASSRRAFRQKTTRLPSGGAWLHEIKHDGFRVIARKDGPRVRLYSRPGNNLTDRFPLIVARRRATPIYSRATAITRNGIATVARRQRSRGQHNHIPLWAGITFIAGGIRHRPLRFSHVRPSDRLPIALQLMPDHYLMGVTFIARSQL